MSVLRHVINRLPEVPARLAGAVLHVAVSPAEAPAARRRPRLYGARLGAMAEKFLRRRLTGAHSRDQGARRLRRMLAIGKRGVSTPTYASRAVSGEGSRT
jgi:hypothetical protein